MWLKTSLLVGAVVALSSSSAWAACAPDILAGRWDAYVYGNTTDEPFWERCVLVFNKSGKILSESNCRTDTRERSSVSGQFVVNSNCRITATLTQQFAGEKPNVCDVPQATLTRDRDSLTGVGTCGDSDSIFSLTLIRR